MASYHFTIKVDQKPDKTAISAATHADYINRDGSFQNIDFKREIDAQVLSGCLLRPASLAKKQRNPHSATLLQNKDAKFLYKSVYGSILETANGIEYTDGASQETKQIALALAKHRYGNELDISGPLSEVTSILRAGQDMDYPVQFSSHAINKNYQKLLEENHHGTEHITQSDNGYDRGRTGQSHPEQSAGRTSQTLHLPHLKSTPRKRPSSKRTPLRVLLQRYLDENHRNPGMLLPPNHAIGLEQPRTQCPDTMRRDFRWGTRRKIDAMTARIWAQIDGITPASRHSDYINRRESFTAKGGCIYTGHHLPKWANNNPKDFFAAADKYERANGTRYREIEFALPNELNTTAQIEIIDTFIEHHLKNHYYAYAIHDKIGVMSNGEHNTHVHIMFSERELDDIEKKIERSAELFFHRANSKHPERGGCPKAAKWNDKNRALYLCEMRRDFAEIQNSVLKKYNVNAQVNHRSLKAQYEEALKKGDMDAALILNRLPEEHLGPALAADKKNQKVINLMEYRAYKFQRSQLASMIDNLKVEHGASFAQNAKENANRAFDDHELHDNNSATLSSNLATLKENVTCDYQALLAIEKVLISKETAHDMAIAHLLPVPDLAIVQAQKKLTQKQDELKTLRTSLLEAGTSAASDDIIQCLTEDILHQQERQNLLSHKFDEIQARLTAPEVQKQLTNISQEILRADKPQQQEYWRLIQKLNHDTQLLQDEMDKEIINHIGNFLSGSTEDTFTTKDINRYLISEERCLKRTLRQKISALDNLKQRLISPERATIIAKSRYLNGADKQLRQDMRNLQKEADRISAAASEYATAQADFAAMPKPKWYQSSTSYNEAMSHVKSLGEALQQRQQDFALKQAKLKKMQSQMEQKCDNPAAKAAISHTATRILQKDKINVARADKINKTIQQLQIRLDDITDMQAAIKTKLILEQPLKLHNENTGGVSARRCMEDMARSLNTPHAKIGGGFSVTLYQHDNRDYDAMNQTEKEAQYEMTSL